MTYEMIIGASRLLVRCLPRLDRKSILIMQEQIDRMEEEWSRELKRMEEDYNDSRQNK